MAASINQGVCGSFSLGRKHQRGNDLLFSDSKHSGQSRMSLRYMSRIYANAGARAFQSLKDQGAKIDGGFKNLQPAGKREGTARNQMRRFSGAAKMATAEDQKRREAEKAEKVYNLICWGPR